MAAAADTNFLLALAEADDDAWDALEVLHERASDLPRLLLPTVVEELRWFSVNEVDSELRQAALKALSSAYAEWRFHTVLLAAEQQARVEQIGSRLRERGLLPAEERHDSLILAEAAVLNCSLLVTEDMVLRGIDFPALAFELNRFNLHPPVLATPREIVHRFYR